MSIPLPPPVQKPKRVSVAQLLERIEALELSILAHKARLDWIDAWLTKSTEK